MSETINLWIDRQTKYTKRYSKRHVTFAQETRRITYAEDEVKKPKGIMTVTKIQRNCELMELKPSELYTIVVDGVHEDGKEEQWVLRLPDREAFDQWYRMITTACAAAGLMEPYNLGLPDVDPRTTIPFTSVPPEYLFKFALLEKAVIHFFGTATLLTPGLKDMPLEHRLVVGDRNVYVFRSSGDVVRCCPVTSIVRMHHGPDATFLALQLKTPMPDLVVKDFAGGVQVAEVLTKLYGCLARKKLNVVAITVPTAELLIDAQKLHLEAGEGYKLQVIPPTSKTRLRLALDTFQRTAGAPGSTGAAGTAAPSAGALPAMGSGDVKSDDPLVQLLQSVNMVQYAQLLLNQHVDLDVLQCMDQTDLKNFGVTDEEHCKVIIEAAQGSADGGLVMGTKASDDPPAAATPAPPGSGGINLDDDDDDDDVDLAVPPPAKPAVNLDDSDSDIDLYVKPDPKTPAKAASKAPILLDDDDDDL